MVTRFLVAGFAALAVHPAAAGAASVAITADPAAIQLAGAPATITVSADVPSNSSNRLSAYVVEGACPASDWSMPGKSWQLYVDGFPSGPVSNSFHFRSDRAGTFSACAYLSPGDGPPQMASAPLVVTPAGGSISLAPTLKVTVRRAWREQIPELSVVATGVTNAAGALSVYAIRDGTTCERPQGDLGVLRLEPDRPARDDPYAATLAAGSFAERFSAEGEALNAQKGNSMVNPVTQRPDHWSGTARFRVCASIAHPDDWINGNERIDGPNLIQAFVVAQAFTFASVTIKPLRAQVLSITRWNWGKPSVDIMFRGCKDDVHLFRGIALRGHAFRAKLRFSDGRRGRLRGRFDRRFRKVSGRIFIARCGTIRFTRRGRF